MRRRAKSERDPLEKAWIGSVQKRMLLVIVVGQTVILSERMEGWNDGGVWPTKKRDESSNWVHACWPG